MGMASPSDNEWDTHDLSFNTPAEDPYGGLNRKQRREAQAAERRAFKKQKQKRNRR